MNKTEAKQRLDAISEEVKELKRIINEPDEVTYGVGDRFIWNSYLGGRECMIVRVNFNKIMLVVLDNGNKHHHIMEVNNDEAITQEEFKRLVGDPENFTLKR